MVREKNPSPKLLAEENVMHPLHSEVGILLVDEDGELDLGGADHLDVDLQRLPYFGTTGSEKRECQLGGAIL